MREKDFQGTARRRRGDTRGGGAEVAPVEPVSNGAASAGPVLVAAAVALTLGAGILTAVSANAVEREEAASSADEANTVSLSYDEPRQGRQSGEITWTWTVANHGSKSAQHVVVTHDVGDSEVSGTPGACTVGNGTVVCRVGELEPGESVAESFDLDLPDGEQQAVLKGRVEWDEGSTTVSKSMPTRLPAKPPARPQAQAQTKPQAPAQSPAVAQPPAQSPAVAQPQAQSQVTPQAQPPAQSPAVAQPRAQAQVKPRAQPVTSR